MKRYRINKYITITVYSDGLTRRKGMGVAFWAGYECAKQANLHPAGSEIRYELLTNPYDPDCTDYNDFMEGKYKFLAEQQKPTQQRSEG